MSEPKRLIILDTETTGLNPKDGHRIVEIGCVELIDMRRTDNDFHHYINPDRHIPEETTRIHGITNEKVEGCPRFKELFRDFLRYIDNAPLVIHNAAFDMRFLNAELERCGQKALPSDRAIDSLTLARRKFPGQPASLDALCKRFQIDNSARTFHGALLDAVLLADVYIELMGGNQFKLNLDHAAIEDDMLHPTTKPTGGTSMQEPHPSRNWPQCDLELKEHDDFLQFIQKESGDNCLWVTLKNPPALGG